MKDHCDHDGAAALVARIRDYWKARGRTARLYMKEAAFDPAMRSARVDVRSDMVNGMPQPAGAAKRGGRKAPAAAAPVYGPRAVRIGGRVVERPAPLPLAEDMRARDRGADA